MRSTYNHDLTKAQLLEPALDAWYCANGFVVDRNNRLSDQLRGIDVRLSRDGRTMVVDEKSQVSYIGRSLTTQALELDYLLHGNRHPGWLFDVNKVNEYFTFVFDIEVHDGHKTIGSSGDIQSFSAIIVKRSVLHQELANIGLTERALLKYVEELRRTRSLYRSLRAPAVRVQRSHQFAEEPINLIVHRSLLEDLAEHLAD